jgi:hypothetical protein
VIAKSFSFLGNGCSAVFERGRPNKAQHKANKSAKILNSFDKTLFTIAALGFGRGKIRNHNKALV